jgi:hypothetical protein
LRMLLDGDDEALALYHAGRRDHPRVEGYFERAGVPLPASRASPPVPELGRGAEDGRLSESGQQRGANR